MTGLHSKRRILVLGAGPLHKEHYRLMRGMGLGTVAMDRDPRAPARSEADVFCCADPGDVAQVIVAARKHDVDAILALSEFGVVPAAEASERLGLPQIASETAWALHDKTRTRRALARNGIPQPRFQIASSLAEAQSAATAFGLPLVVKPPALSSARGVRVVERPQELPQAYEEAHAISPGELLLEERIVGVETSVEGAVVEGKATVLACGDKDLRPHPRYRVTRSINYPAALSDQQLTRIRGCAQAVMDAVGLRNSPFHLEVFVCGDRVLPIECAARGGGGHIYSHIVELVSGQNLLRLAVQLLLGERPTVPEPEVSFGACYRFLFPPEGRCRSVEGIKDVMENDRVVDLVIGVAPGTVIREPEHGAQRAGYLVTRGADREEACAAADWAESALRWDRD